MAAQETRVSWPFSRKPQASSQLPRAQGPVALESFISRQYAFVWRLLRGFGLSAPDAEDAAQQVLMIAARKLETIAPDRERSFVYGVTVRVANNARRGARRRREVPSDDHADVPETEAHSPEQLAELVHARALLADLLEKLPDKLRRALVLAELEELPVNTIAELERIPVVTSASRLRLARKQWRTLLADASQRNPFAEEP